MPAVVNLRGTSGAGKSTVVRRVMEKYVPGGEQAVFQEGRRQPLAYLLRPPREGMNPLYIPGHYETPAGGCDTLPTIDRVYELVEGAAEKGYDVLFEGIMVQDGRLSRFMEFYKKYQPTVIELTTPIQECLAGVQARRDARGDIRPLNPKNTIQRAERVRRGCSRIRDAGGKVLKLDREAAYQECLRVLGWI